MSQVTDPVILDSTGQIIVSKLQDVIDAINGGTIDPLTVTQNGTYTPSGTTLGYGPVTVNVGGGGGNLVYEIGTFSPDADISRPQINFKDTHAEAPIFVAMTDVTDSSSPSDTNLLFVYYDPYKLFGAGFPLTSTNLRYGSMTSYHRTSSSGSGSHTEAFQYSSDNAGTSGAGYPRYWVTETGFVPGASTSRYWRNGRIYKWIAVWKP